VVVNHKQGLRLMREDNPLRLCQKSFVRSTDSAHSLVVYPNLLPKLTVNGPDQL
jgi:hypothetical protein